MNTLLMIGLDLVAILLLVLGVYLPRHRRTDLVTAFIGVNVAVLVVTMVLATSTVGAGLGLGLFGVLSIIRLRSSEISQHEVAYYFAALALGLITGLSATPSLPVLAGVGLIIAALALGDSRLLLGAQATTLVQLDRAVADGAELRALLAQRLGGRIDTVKVLKLDEVNDLTFVEVRHRAPGSVREDAHAEEGDAPLLGRREDEARARTSDRGAGTSPVCAEVGVDEAGRRASVLTAVGER